MTDPSPDSLQLKAIQFLAAKRLDRFYLHIASTLDGSHPTIVTSSSTITEVPSSGAHQTTDTSSSDQIKLDLVMWRYLLNGPAKSFDDQREKIRYIFNFFIKVGQKNGLHGTPAVTNLESALVALGEEGEFEGTPKEKWEERICQRTLAEIEQDLDRLPNRRAPGELPAALTADNTPRNCQTAVSQVQPLYSPRDVYKAIPLFNIWDSLSFLYTTCVEDINSQLAAELHLFQFRMIINALRTCDYFPGFAGPTTVGSAWSTSEPFLIGYATTCVGPKKGSHVAKEEMAKARCKFIATITNQLRVPINIGVVNCPNRPGNCPEFFTWTFVCRDPGNYFSLCFSTEEIDGKAKSLKFCDYCKDIAQFLKQHKIDITDLWDKALLCDDEAMPFTRKGKLLYPFRRLQSADQVIKLFKKLPVPDAFFYPGI
jgi:hypothetical protein